MNTLIFILAFIGFITSGYIYWKKSHNQKLICLIGDDCDLVINSKYNNLFGISNEIIGMLYYLFIAVSSGLIYWNFNVTIFNPIILISTGGAALYSLSLILIQAFVIKEWCEYCLLSAGISILIFVLKITPILALY